MIYLIAVLWAFPVAHPRDPINIWTYQDQDKFCSDLAERQKIIDHDQDAEEVRGYQLDLETLRIEQVKCVVTPTKVLPVKEAQ